jgi:hypothetical protein
VKTAGSAKLLDPLGLAETRLIGLAAGVAYRITRAWTLVNEPADVLVIGK